ncbi:hypothetical protein JKY72_05350 [Candidatus Gracilibacteria bacterium]|nr:hypothetical protein [Candidatus Gracilibacteria bacterium]
MTLNRLNSIETKAERHGESISSRFAKECPEPKDIKFNKFESSDLGTDDNRVQKMKELFLETIAKEIFPNDNILGERLATDLAYSFKESATELTDEKIAELKITKLSFKKHDDAGKDLHMMKLTAHGNKNLEFEIPLRSSLTEAWIKRRHEVKNKAINNRKNDLFQVYTNESKGMVGFQFKQRNLEIDKKPEDSITEKGYAGYLIRNAKNEVVYGVQISVEDPNKIKLLKLIVSESLPLQYIIEKSRETTVKKFTINDIDNIGEAEVENNPQVENPRETQEVTGEDKDKLFKEAGIDMSDAISYKFQITGVERSFKKRATEEFMKKFDTLFKNKKTSRAEKVQLVQHAFYARLLSIIKRDGSIDKESKSYNKWNVGNGKVGTDEFNKSFDNSNAELIKLVSNTPTTRVDRTTVAQGERRAGQTTAKPTVRPRPEPRTEETPKRSTGKTRRTARENLDTQQTKIRHTTYLQEYKTLSKKEFTLTKNVGEMYEEKMKNRFLKMNGNKAVINIMKKEPFKLHHTDIPRIFAEIVSEDDNDKVHLKDIFKFMKGFSTQAQFIVGESLLKDKDKFIEEFQKLADNKNKTADEERKYAYMFKVLSKSFDLLNAISKLTHGKVAPTDWDKGRSPGTRIQTKMKEQKDFYENLYKNQIPQMKALFKLCSYEQNKQGDWAKIIALLFANNVDQMTMVNIDGKTSTIDRGEFQRYNSPRSAFDDLINTPGMTAPGDKGVEMIQEAPMIKELNRLITLGFLNQYLRENTEKGNKTNFKGLKKDTIFQKRLKLRLLTSLDADTMSPLSIIAFQAGYLIDRTAKFENQFDRLETKEGENVKPQHPALEKMVKTMIAAGYGKKDITKVQSAVLGGAMTQVTETSPGKYELTAGGVGSSIKLSDGSTLNWGFGATKDGEFLGGLALKWDIVKTDGYSLQGVAEIGVNGAALGMGHNAETKYINFSLFIGGNFSFANIIPTVGGSFMLSWNAKAQFERERTSKEEKSQFHKLWNDWKKLPSGSSKSKFESLQKIKPLWDKLRPLQDDFNLTPAHIIKMIDRIKEEITSETLDELASSPIPIISSVGIVMVGAVPIPVIGLKIGSAKLNTPNRKEISKLLPLISDRRTFEKALKTVEAGKTKFHNELPQLVYGRDGEILILEKSRETNLTTIKKEPDLKEYNEALKPSRIRLEKDENGNTELIIEKTEDKDSEIYLDPNVIGIRIRKENGKLYLEGDISDLIISRERFKLPFPRDRFKASIRDVIVIRQSSSLKAGNGTMYIQEKSGSMFQKLRAEKNYELQRGASDRAQTNIYEGHARAPLSRIDPTIEKNKDRKTAVKERLLTMNTIKYQDFAEQSLGKDFFIELDDFYTKNKKAFAAVADNPTKIIQIFAKAGVKLNDRQASVATMYILDKHFTTLVKKKNAPAIKRGIENRIKWIRPIFKKQFGEILTRIGEDPTRAGELTDMIMMNIYDDVLQKLKSGNLESFTNQFAMAVPAGAAFFSGSRTIEKGTKRAMVMTRTPNSASMSQMPRVFGFLSDTIETYELDEENPTKRLLAQVLLEAASPTPKEDLDFLTAPLALKLASMSVKSKSGKELAPLMVGGLENYKLINEIFIDNSKLNSPKHKKAFQYFKELVTGVRNAQLAGKTFERKLSNGAQIKIRMTTEIMSGAYTKCANASFYVRELGSIEVTETIKGLGVRGVYNETIDRIESKQSKIHASAFAGVAVVQATPKRTPVQKEGGKHSKGGPKENPPKGAGGNPNRRPTDTEPIVYSKGQAKGPNKASGSISPSGH